MKWLDKAWWKGLEKVAALEWDGAEDSVCRMVILKKDEHRIKLVSSRSFDNVAAAMGYLEKQGQLAVVLCAWGGGVLERGVAKAQLGEAAQVILGTQHGGDFYCMGFWGAGDGAWVAMARKEKVDGMLGRMGKLGDRVVDVVLSRLVVMEFVLRLEGALGVGGVQIVEGPRQYWLREGQYADAGQMSGLGYVVTEVAVLEEEAGITRGDGVLWGAVLHVWNRMGGGGLSEGPVEGVRRRFLQIASMRQAAMAAVVVLVLGFAGLFSLRMQGEQKKGELEQLYAQNLPVLEALNRLDEKIAARVGLRDELGHTTLRPSRGSYYLDRIAAVTPLEIRLHEIVYLPEEVDYKRCGIEAGDEAELIVRGACGKSGPVAVFSSALAGLEWVKGVKSVKSERNFQVGAYEFTFLIQAEDV